MAVIAVVILSYEIGKIKLNAEHNQSFYFRIGLSQLAPVLNCTDNWKSCEMQLMWLVQFRNTNMEYDESFSPVNLRWHPCNPLRTKKKVHAGSLKHIVHSHQTPTLTGNCNEHRI
jgi:hypothetical protein